MKTRFLLKYENLKTDKKEKKIVYFGRIHPHKNLNLLIDSFIEANLDSNWKLYIYGIPDDENYLSELSLKLKIFKMLLKSQFLDLKRLRKMNTAWMNVLLSKSEVLSYQFWKLQIMAYQL